MSTGGIEVDNSCVNAGDVQRCPTDTTYTFNDVNYYIDSAMTCPLDSVEQSDFIKVSQTGQCDCVVDIYGPEETPPLQTLGQEPCRGAQCEETQGDIVKLQNCKCMVCPQGSTLGFAIDCENAAVGPCKSFDCFGTCNGDLIFLADPASGLAAITDQPPTEAPTDSAAHLTSSWLVLGLVILRMIR